MRGWTVLGKANGKEIAWLKIPGDVILQKCGRVVRVVDHPHYGFDYIDVTDQYEAYELDNNIQHSEWLEVLESQEAFLSGKRG
jgi:hypothetical protein